MSNHIWKKRELTLTDLSGKIKARFSHLDQLGQFNFASNNEAIEFSEKQMYDLAIFILGHQQHHNPDDYRPYIIEDLQETDLKNIKEKGESNNG